MAKYLLVACVLLACFGLSESEAIDSLNKIVKRYIENGDFCTNVTSCSDIQDIINKHTAVKTGHQAIKQTVWELQGGTMVLQDAIATMMDETPPPTKISTTPLQSCEEGWRLIDGHCYYLAFLNGFKNWEVAYSHCRMMGSYLVEINDYDELTFLQRDLLSEISFETSTYKYLWTGATLKENQRDVVGGPLAIYNHSGEEVPYKCWSPRQPDDGNGEYKCVAIEMVNYEALWLMDCNTSHAYVCEKP